MEPKTAAEVRMLPAQTESAGSVAQPSPMGNPKTRVQMELSIAQIKPYDFNPRRSRNPIYAELKESIRATLGKSVTFAVTRRPGEILYMVAAGGNTRHQIVTELYNETKDPVFERLLVLFQPWEKESRVLRDHLDENINRAPMSFIDQSLGFFELRRQLEHERGTSLSDKHFMAYLAEQGLGKYSTSHYYRMKYAVDALLHVLPMALEAGLSSYDVEKIKQQQTLYKTFWLSKRQYDEEGFVVIFRQALAALDEPDFSVELVSEAVETKLAKQLGIPHVQVRQEVDLLRLHAMAGKPINPLDLRSPSTPAISQPNAPPPIKHESAPIASAQDQLPPSSVAKATASTTPRLAAPKEKPATVTLLRKLAFETAQDFAKLNQLSCVHPLPVGMGFYVDLTDDPFTSHTQEHVWWLIVSASEQLANQQRLERLPTNNRMRQLILSDPDQALLELGKAPTIDALHFLFLHDLTNGESDLNYHAFLKLTETCRHLRKLTTSAGADLWEGA